MTIIGNLISVIFVCALKKWTVVIIIALLQCSFVVKGPKKRSVIYEINQAFCFLVLEDNRLIEKRIRKIGSDGILRFRDSRFLVKSDSPREAKKRMI